MKKLYDLNLERASELETRISKIKHELTSLPEEQFISCKNGKSSKWYVKRNQIWTYLPRSKRKLAEKLAQRKYLEALLNDLTKEKLALDMYLRHFNANNVKSAEMTAQTSPYLDLIKPLFKPKDINLEKWASAEYETNPFHQENLIISTSNGIKVRSKSELLIADALYFNRIPFRYESLLHLNGLTYYPDFTVANPITGEFIYWEHFGMMDSPEYATNAMEKINKYTNGGLILGKNLIITTETKAHPLDNVTVNRIIDVYFKSVGI